MSAEQQLAAAGLPYEITEVFPQFLLSGKRAVVALYKHGQNLKAFAGFYLSGEEPVIEKAAQIRGVYSIYVVEAKEVMA